MRKHEGSNIIEAISVSGARLLAVYVLDARAAVPEPIGAERRDKYAVISNFSNSPTKFSKNHSFPIHARPLPRLRPADEARGHTISIHAFHPFYFRDNLGLL